jgi:hypothetical protein
MRQPALIALLAALVSATSARANDRLPPRLREPYAAAMKHVRKYIPYILRKVWRPKIAELYQQRKNPAALKARVDEMVDEIVHLLLPYTSKLLDDAVFGTRETHLRITMPERLAMAERAAQARLKAGPTGTPKSANEAVTQAMRYAGSVAERELNDRLSQALTEDVEDFTQREVEGYVGLPLVGRPRGAMRDLPQQWETPYEAQVRRDVHVLTHWYMRKKRRLQLTHLAMTMSHKELDRARDKGAVWALTSDISQEAWAQNRLRVDYVWGRPNWEIDRRRIRRRMDQDEAQATWALAKLVKETASSKTSRAVREHLDRRAEEEMKKHRAEAERYPDTRAELERAMEGLTREIDPILNRAMDRVKLPGLRDDLRELAREYGRRYVHDDLRGEIGGAVQRAAAPHVAARRVREQLPAWVGEAVSRFEAPESAKDDELAKKLREHVKTQVDPRIDDEVTDAMRAAGMEHTVWNKAAREKTVRDVSKRFRFDEAIDREIERFIRR